jgi:excisionase family DNA binding protein
MAMQAQAFAHLSKASKSPVAIAAKINTGKTLGIGMPDYLKFDHIANNLGLPVRTIYHLNKTGEGPKCLKVGRTYLVSREDYETWLTQRKQD